MMNDKKTNNRSDSYQWKICEIPCDINLFSETSDLDCKLHESRFSPRFSDLNDQAMQRILDIAAQVLTEHQYNILKLFLEGYTQMEIATALNVNQSSVTKSLNGNADYKQGATVKYGGVNKKLRRFILQDEVLKSIFKEMRICDDLMWRIRNPNPTKVYCKTNNHSNSNIYYMTSTMFKSDDLYEKWMNSPPVPPR